jgi:nucleotide-binding universal stress UspA family protein
VVIVVGYTHRPESQAALERAVEEARFRDARLHIVRLLEQGPSENPGQVKEWAHTAQQGREEGAELVERLAGEGVTATFEFEPRSKPAAEQLIHAAEEQAADLIVIGIRRRSPVGKLVLGSVSQDVLLRAECPVLAVKAPVD